MTALYNFAADVFARNAQRHSKTAYIDDSRELSYGQLEAQARGFAASLLASGARAEERLLLLAHDGCDWPVAFLGAQWAGLAPVCLNTLLTAEDYAYMLEHSRPRAAVVSAALLPVFEQALALAAHRPATVWISGGTASSHSTAGGFAAFSSACAAAPLAQPCATRGDDIGLWLYSSGSTGKPKGAVHSHASQRATAQLYGEAVLGIRDSDVCFSAAKLYFAYGLGNGLTFPLWAGATTVLMAERPTPAAVFVRWTRAAHRPTVFFGAPTGFAGMLASPERPAKAAIALRLCSSAGEALPRELGERFLAAYGCNIVDGIGSTEMLHIFLSNTPSDVRYGTSGKPVAGYAVSLRREDGGEAGVDEIGDLYIHGPSAALMYWVDSGKSRATFQGEWTKSGDKYTRDAAGYYTYSGRSDDMLKVSGQYVSPFEVEGVLQRHPAVLEAAVVGVDDEHGLTRAKAYVVLKAGQAPHSDALIDEIKAFVKSQLAPHKYPRIVTVVAELPKTATGKIQRFRLRELG
jgi:benzoate-CoA ligase